MRHQDLTINHVLESWTFATAAARNTAGSYASGDLGRISYQQDTGEYYRLLTVAPTWALIALPSTATFQTATPQNPPALTTLTSGNMAGLGSATYGGATITPVRSGKIFVTACGATSNSSTGGVQIVIRYGTGTAPNNGATGSGTSIGGIVILSNAALAAGKGIPFCAGGIAVGLTLGTVYWLDLLVVPTNSGTATVATVEIGAFELP